MVGATAAVRVVDFGRDVVGQVKVRVGVEGMGAMTWGERKEEEWGTWASFLGVCRGEEREVWGFGGLRWVG